MSLLCSGFLRPLQPVDVIKSLVHTSGHNSAELPNKIVITKEKHLDATDIKYPCKKNCNLTFAFASCTNQSPDREVRLEGIVQFGLK